MNAPCEENSSTVPSTSSPSWFPAIKVIKFNGSLSGSAGNSPTRLLRLRLRALFAGSTASSTATAMARCNLRSPPRPRERSAAMSRPLSSGASGDSSRFLRLASLTDSRLLGPRTGVRGVKIQPTPGTGLPPIRRPLSKSHSYSPWNSWNESFDNTTAPTLSATLSRKASPLPIAPAGGLTISAPDSASSKSCRSSGGMRWPNVASTTTVTTSSGFSMRNSRTASSSCARLGSVRPSVARLDPSTTT